MVHILKLTLYTNRVNSIFVISVSPQLPNITGYTGKFIRHGDTFTTGALQIADQDASETGAIYSPDIHNYRSAIQFNASWSNSTYCRTDNAVIPWSLTSKFYIKY